MEVIISIRRQPALSLSLSDPLIVIVVVKGIGRVAALHALLVLLLLLLLLSLTSSRGNVRGLKHSILRRVHFRQKETFSLISVACLLLMMIAAVRGLVLIPLLLLLLLLVSSLTLLILLLLLCDHTGYFGNYDWYYQLMLILLHPLLKRCIVAGWVISIVARGALLLSMVSIIVFMY